MRLTKLALALTAVGLIASGGASAQPMSKEAHEQAIQRAETQYKQDKSSCDTLSGNAKDVCMEQAKGKEKVAKADADAAYRNTPQAREAALLTRADAAYEVAKERCDDLSGNPKDVCLKEAKAAEVKAKADAKVDRAAADARKDVNEAQRDAASDKREADYKVAIEKCDALSGAAKDACVRDAKARFGKV